ncbi:hypothetical protein EMWEY_00052110, partial [Eimeria maxima]
TLAQLRRRRERRPLQRLRLQQRRLHASVGRPFDGGASYNAAEDTTTPSTGDTAATTSSSDSSSSSSGSSTSRMTDRPTDSVYRRRMHGPHEGAPPTSDSSSGAHGAPAEGMRSSSVGGPTPTSSRGAPSSSRERGPSSIRRPPPYWQRALYQGVAMFFLTAIPSWNPNPELLLDYEEEEAEEEERRGGGAAAVAAEGGRGGEEQRLLDDMQQLQQ